MPSNQRVLEALADTLAVTITGIAVILAGALIVGEIVIRTISGLARKAGLASGVVRDIREALTLVVLAAAITAIARFTGLTSDFTTLTISGIAGLAISLALQTTLSNIISGILLFHDGVLRLGDEIEYSGTKGKIVKIGFRNTWVQDEKNSIVVISNTSLASGPLKNSTASTRLEKLLK